MLMMRIHAFTLAAPCLPVLLAPDTRLLPSPPRGVTLSPSMPWSPLSCPASQPWPLGASLPDLGLSSSLGSLALRGSAASWLTKAE